MQYSSAKVTVQAIWRGYPASGSEARRLAKQLSDRYTADLLGNRPGRPPKPNALTGAQRAKRFRDVRRLIPVTRNENGCEWCGAAECSCNVCGMSSSKNK